MAGALLLLAALSATSIALAAESRSGGEVVVETGAPVREDLYVAAGFVRIEGDVAGDVTALAADLRVEGQVGGSVNALSARTVVEGSIGRTLRVAGGLVEIRGRVGGDLIVAGGWVRVHPGSAVDGDVVVSGGNVDVNGQVGGDVRGSTTRMTLGGRIGGGVEVDVSQLSVRSGASIAGDLVYTSPWDASVPAGAEIGGDVRYTSANPVAIDDAESTMTLLGPLRWLLWALITGAVIVALLPRGAEVVARRARRLLPSFATGLLAVWTVPLLAILLILTPVGLPIGVLTVLCWGIALFVGPIFAGLALGSRLLPRRWDDGGRGFNLLGMTLGVIALSIVRLLPLPYLSSVVGLLATVLGLGAIVLTAIDRGRLRRRTVPVALAGNRP
ncbi:MAG: hypothetical protein M3N47_11495 [Chloroflexota bacterium]|nr:hypothetical protein [Chloroflexota bacterium]